MQPDPQNFPSPSESESAGFLAAISDSFGSSVRESIFTYQVAAFKRRCVTAAGYRPPASYQWPSSSGRVGVGSGTMIIAVVGRVWHMVHIAL